MYTYIYIIMIYMWCVFLHKTCVLLYIYIDWSPCCCKSAFLRFSRFQVKVEALEETLDRFARFFSEPLLTKAPGRNFGCVMGRSYFFELMSCVLTHEKVMTPHLYENKRSNLYHEGDKSNVLFLLFSLIIVEILVHGKDCTEREINAVDSEFQAGAMTCGKSFCYFRWFALFARPYSYINFVNLCFESAYLCHPINDIESCDHLVLTRPWDA